MSSGSEGNSSSNFRRESLLGVPPKRLFRLSIAPERNEFHGNHGGLFHHAAMLLEPIQLLAERFTDRNDHPASFVELVDQRLRNVIWRCRDDDRVERCVLRPALVTVAGLDMDVPVTELAQPNFSALGER